MRGAVGVRAGRLAGRLVAPAVTALLVAPVALADPKSPSWWRPPVDVSKDGWRVEKLFWYTTATCAIAFALVLGALVTFSIRFRQRPGHRALYDHGTRRASIMFTTVLALAVFFGIDMVLVAQSQVSIKEYLFNFPKEGDVVRVEVMAQQWAWNFRYAGPDGKFNTEDDVVTLNDLRIPVGRPVMLNLKAKDVIHSFYVPNFRIKHDANPGYVTRTWFEAKEPGKFEIACSQMCGWAHYKMRGELTVLSQKDYEAWLKDAEADAARRYDPADKDVMWGWEWMN
jgi:cytochrome c oxidase subunit II